MAHRGDNKTISPNPNLTNIDFSSDDGKDEPNDQQFNCPKHLTGGNIRIPVLMRVRREQERQNINNNLEQQADPENIVIKNIQPEKILAGSGGGLIRQCD